MSTTARRLSRRSYTLGLIVVICLLVSLVASPLGPGLLGGPKEPGHTSGGLAKLDPSEMPLAFESNVGQAAPPARFIAHAKAGTVVFAPSEVTLALAGADPGSKPAQTCGLQAGQENSAVPHLADRQAGGNGLPAAPPALASSVTVRFVGADAGATIKEGGMLPSKINYFLGNDPSAWHANLPTYSGISYSGLYPGIDLGYSGTGSQLKGTYTVAPEADPTRIRWQYDGAGAVSIDGAGNLQIQVVSAGVDASTQARESATTITEQAPVAWQQIGEQRVSVSVRYRLAPDGSIGFHLGSYDPGYPLTIDPTLTYSTFLGGDNREWDVSGNNMTVDAAGYIYVTGGTLSANFPTRDAYQPQYHGGLDYGDAFIVKLNPNAPPDQQLVYATYLGGGTLSGDPGNSGPDVGPGDDTGQGIALDAEGNIYVSGATASLNFPLQDPIQPNYGGGDFDLFIAKLNPTGSALIYSTYLGGNGWDDGTLVVNGAGEVYIGGETASTNMPMVNPFQSSNHGIYDAFIAKINAAGSALLYSTYLGGTSWDFGVDFALDSSDKIYITGDTSSANFPTHNAFQPTGGGTYGNDLNFDAFASVLDPSASGQQQLFYSTYLGGVTPATLTNVDSGRSIAVDGNGNLYVAGDTGTLDFPISQGAFQTTFGGGVSDAFVARLDPSQPPAEQLIFSTYLGGNGMTISFDTEGVMGLALDAAGNVYVTGRTDSSNFPLHHPIQDTYMGICYDAFVASLDPTGSSLGFSTFLGGNGPNAGNVFTEQGSNIVLDNSGRIYIFGDTDAADFPVQNAFQPTYGGGTLDAFVAIISLAPPTTPTPTATSSVPPVLTATSTSTPTSSHTPMPPPPTVTATVTATATAEPTVCSISFSDVPPGSTFYEYIQCLACHGVVSGYADGTFCPNNNVTRGQTAKIISNAANYQDVIPPNRQTFNDVAPNSTFWLYVERVASHGAISGYPCGGPGEPCPGTYFRPANNLTRGQLAKIDSNVAGYQEQIPPNQQSFNDVPPSDTFWLYIERIRMHGVISGYPCGGPGEPCPGTYFRSHNNVTRGQASKVVANSFFPECSLPNP